MTKSKHDILTQYIAECVSQGKLLTINEIGASDALDFSEGPVYTHFGSIGRLQFQALVEALAWTDRDVDDVLEERGMSRDDLLRQRA